MIRKRVESRTYRYERSPKAAVVSIELQQKKTHATDIILLDAFVSVTMHVTVLAEIKPSANHMSARWCMTAGKSYNAFQWNTLQFDYLHCKNPSTERREILLDLLCQPDLEICLT